MKVLLVYPPFCAPTVPPYSITYLQSFLSANSDVDVKCIDLNAKFHMCRMASLYNGLEKAKRNLKSYSELLEKYSSKAKKVHRENIVKISEGAAPELFKELAGLLLKEKPDVVGFSIVYNSQIFYSLSLIEKLTDNGITCVAGGPAASQLVRERVKVLDDEVALLRFLTKKEKCKAPRALDFSHYPEEDYLSKEMIYPIRSSYGCFYRACAFCTHHGNVAYREIDVKEIKKSILKNRMKNIFFIDDTIPARRLSELADMLKPLKVRWWCQTRPTQDLLGLFNKLRETGLVAISFGAESGNQRMLDLMRKGTRVDDVKKVLSESHNAGIKNIVFIMFGFPGEDESSFIDTVNFLRDNRGNLDIVSASMFGLQKGSCVFDNPGEFGVFDIMEHGAPLGEIIRFEVRNGLGEKQAKAMKENVAKELRAMNKLPKIFCLLKEQSLFF
ncbi:MAG: B12-binding domain-containing radical SAM protein [Methanobacteriota archaeon]